MQHCLACGEEFDTETIVFGVGRPKPGDYTVCLYCGHIMAFDSELRVQDLTGEQMLEVAGDKRIVALNTVRGEAMRGHPKFKKRGQDGQ